MAGGKLTALQVTRVKAPGMYGDGKEKIAKSWIFRYRFKGHLSKAGKPLAREMGLGSLDTWTLAEARERARLQYQLLDQGLDPIEARKTQEPAALLGAGGSFRAMRQGLHPRSPRRLGERQARRPVDVDPQDVGLPDYRKAVGQWDHDRPGPEGPSAAGRP
jgi:hypothetical protein